MKKYLVPVAIVAVLAGGSFFAGFAAMDHLYSDAYAEGAASVDAGPETDAVVSAVPDPVSDPGGAVSTVWELWKGARLPAVILAAFLLAVAVHRKGWLSGRAAFYLGVAVAAAGTIAERAAAGDTPSVALIVQFAGTVALAVWRFEFGPKEQA